VAEDEADGAAFTAFATVMGFTAFAAVMGLVAFAAVAGFIAFTAVVGFAALATVAGFASFTAMVSLAARFGGQFSLLGLVGGGIAAVGQSRLAAGSQEGRHADADPQFQALFHHADALVVFNALLVEK